MALRVYNNIYSMNAQRNLGNNSAALGSSLEKLSSGLRINRGADDAAGLAISEALRSDIRSLNQALRNANDGISLINTAEGALSEQSSILVRMRELASQAATGTVGSTERATINREFSALRSEIDRISSVTEFNGQKLVDGSLAAGAGATVDPADQALYDQWAAGFNQDPGGTGGGAGWIDFDSNGNVSASGYYNSFPGGLVVSNWANGLTIPAWADPKAGTINGGFYLYGGSQTVIGAPQNQAFTIFLGTSPPSAGGSGSVVIHVGMGSTSNDRINLNAAVDLTAIDSTGLNITNISVTHVQSALDAMTRLDSAISTVTSGRGKLGAVQNRLVHTINNLSISAENLQAAESQIRDADYSAEISKFTRNQILTQAATAILAQANLVPQSVLQLLG